MAHRRFEAGGDPAQAPTAEPGGSTVGTAPDEFPDIPPGNRPDLSPGHDAPDRRHRGPDLDAFAERLGLRHDTADTDTADADTAGTDTAGTDTADADARPAGPAARAAATVARTLARAAGWTGRELERIASRIDPR